MNTKRSENADMAIAKAMVKLAKMTQQQRDEVFLQAEENSTNCPHCAVSLAVVATMLKNIESAKTKT